MENINNPNQSPLELLLQSKLSSSVTIAITADDLIKVLAHTAKNAVENYCNGEKDVTYSPDQVCEILRVSRPTLWTWGKKGVLQPIKVGKSVRYKKLDVDNLLNKKNKRYDL